MKFLVLGAGQMGHAVVFDLIRSPRTEKIGVADCNAETLKRLTDRLADKRIVTCEIDVTNFDEVVKIMAGFDVAISCVTYKHNWQLAKAALQAGIHFCDLGGNEDIVAQEFLLDDLAKERGITIIPDCGLAPGLVSILAAAAADSMEELYEIKLRVGGIPANPKPPLNYSLEFSVDGLINQYIEDATIIRNGRLMKVSSLTDLEDIHFPAPFHTLEAFNTSGGVSTLPRTYGAKVQHLDYKTIRYKGHCDKIRLLNELGLFDSKPQKIGKTEVVLRDLTKTLLEKKLSKNEPDVVLVRVIVTGVKGGKPSQIIWDCIDYMDEAACISAMMRMTAFPASIIAQLICRGDIKEKGVLKQETNVPAALFLTEMAARGIHLEMLEKAPAAR